MVRSYQKYEQSQAFGVIASSASNIVWAPDDLQVDRLSRSTGAGRAFVGANEEVLCWDIKKSELLHRWRDPSCSALVTAITRSASDPDVFAVGYADGSIRLWDSSIATVIIRFDGHRAAVTQLSFDSQGTRLASGSKDTDIILWDLVGETSLFKLRGHKDQITGIQFISRQSHISPSDGEEDGNDNAEQGAVAFSAAHTLRDEYLLSTSKDALVKLWDLTSQYCVETHITQSNGECWSLGISPDGAGFMTAGIDGEFKVWLINQENLHKVAKQADGHESVHVLLLKGTLSRQGKDRITGIEFHRTQDFVAIYGSEKAVEIWRIRTSAEVQKSLARKRRRRKEKLANAEDGDAMTDGDGDGGEPVDAETSMQEIFVPYVIVRTGGKVQSLSWSKSSPKSISFLVGESNNQLEVYSIPTKTPAGETPDYDKTCSVDLAGHRADIRAIALSSDDRMIATASNGALKIWNAKTQTCLRTLQCGYALCCTFLPGDKIVIVGNKSGELELFDIAASSLLETVKAHDSSIWTMKVPPDGRSVLTGSADNTAKFWDFQVVQENVPGTKRSVPRLKLVHSRTLKVNDDILSVCFSPDARLLAVSTLDNTVKVFFVDSLKLFLNLYGHKLPVLNISISSDNKLIATCSADKNIRIWGLDFGDCHKALFAHDESVMQVGFIPHPVSVEDNHLIFSASKDHNLKTWDGDKFQHIQRLGGHHGEVWAMVVSQTGDFVATASHDKSIRIWRQTDEPLFLEEERERELEEMYDKTVTTSLQKDQMDDLAIADARGEMVEAVDASKQTAATLNAGEKITEALKMCTEDLELMTEYEARKQANPSATIAPPQRSPFLALRNISAEAHLLVVFEAIPSPALHDALLLLSFSILPQLFTFLQIWLERGLNVVLTCRVLFFLLKVHHKQLVSSKELRLLLTDINIKLRNRLNATKEMIGYNMVATSMLGQRSDNRVVFSIDDAEGLEKAGGGMSGMKGTKRPIPW